MADFVEDRTHDGRKIRMLNIVDIERGNPAFQRLDMNPHLFKYVAATSEPVPPSVLRPWRHLSPPPPQTPLHRAVR